jgi:hypothetical protein
LKLNAFLHGVDEGVQPPAQEHPTQGGLPDLGLDAQPPAQLRVAWTGAALAGAIDEMAITKPATKSNEAFMAMSSQKLGREMLIPATQDNTPSIRS